MRSASMEAALMPSAYAVIKKVEREYEDKHPGEIVQLFGRRPTLEEYAIAIGARMRSRQGFCPIVTFAAEMSTAEISCAPESDFVSEGHS
jgi:hypothetical protein